MTRLFTGVAAVLAVATIVGLIVLWPGEVESGIADGILVDIERG